MRPLCGAPKNLTAFGARTFLGVSQQYGSETMVECVDYT
jgi:hypothetical protein